MAISDEVVEASPICFIHVPFRVHGPFVGFSGEVGWGYEGFIRLRFAVKPRREFEEGRSVFVWSSDRTALSAAQATANAVVDRQRYTGSFFGVVRFDPVDGTTSVEGNLDLLEAGSDKPDARQYKILLTGLRNVDHLNRARSVVDNCDVIEVVCSDEWYLFSSKYEVTSLDPLEHEEVKDDHMDQPPPPAPK